jgi:DNA-directed RNA polymerase subunit RPC12/RpoP
MPKGRRFTKSATGPQSSRDADDSSGSPMRRADQIRCPYCVEGNGFKLMIVQGTAYVCMRCWAFRERNVRYISVPLQEMHSIPATAWGLKPNARIRDYSRIRRSCRAVSEIALISSPSGPDLIRRAQETSPGRAAFSIKGLCPSVKNTTGSGRK